MTRHQFLLSLIGAAGAAVIGQAAFAQTAAEKDLVDAAKARGEVGEQADGLLGFVKPSSDAVLRAAVNAINTGRQGLYRQAAARNNVTPEAAGASTFETVIQGKLKAGEYYRTPAGAWVRK